MCPQPDYHNVIEWVFGKLAERQWFLTVGIHSGSMLFIYGLMDEVFIKLRIMFPV